MPTLLGAKALHFVHDFANVNIPPCRDLKFRETAIRTADSYDVAGSSTNIPCIQTSPSVGVYLVKSPPRRSLLRYLFLDMNKWFAYQDPMQYQEKRPKSQLMG